MESIGIGEEEAFQCRGGENGKHTRNRNEDK